jgi:DNA repair exonuclease SbcCD ATPase subunit
VYKDIIDSLPDDIKNDFTIDSIYDKIADSKVIYDEKKINQLLSLTTEYDNYINLQKEYDEQKSLIQKFSGLSNSVHLKDQIENLNDDATEVRSKIKNWKERNILLTEEKDECQKSLEVYYDVKETLEKYDEIKELYEKLTADYKLFNDTYDKISEINLEISKLKISIESKSSQKQKMEIDLNQYISIRKDIKKMNKIYDEMTYVKESLSSKQGIPLHYIRNYLRNTEEITNELLDIAYDGQIYLDSFEISATEFSIPFYNKGLRLPDVKFASQGELSFLSVALAFALSSQALAKYNIMLLDELDGPLDTSNREKFIQILENQIERINAEQSFLITHNVMFSAYPVDILDFSFKNDTKQYPLANFIEIVR